MEPGLEGTLYIIVHMRLVLARTLFVVNSIATFAVSKPVPATSPHPTSNQSLSEPPLHRVMKVFIVAPANSINIEALKTARAFPSADPVKYKFALLNPEGCADHSSVDMTDSIVAAMASVSSKPDVEIEVKIVDIKLNTDHGRALEVVDRQCLKGQSCVLAIPLPFTDKHCHDDLNTLRAPANKRQVERKSEALYVSPITKGKNDWKKSRSTYAKNIDLFVHTPTPDA
ncbi:hypothetical protein H0H93_013498, partial [Arthromyces matolae]